VNHEHSSVSKVVAGVDGEAEERGVMSTEIKTSGNFHLTQFYGGVDRGTCYQITDHLGRFVQLTLPDIVELAEILAKNNRDGWKLFRDGSDL
jgi:hypothetical protein